MLFEQIIEILRILLFLILRLLKVFDKLLLNLIFIEAECRIHLTLFYFLLISNFFFWWFIRLNILFYVILTFILNPSQRIILIFLLPCFELSENEILNWFLVKFWIVSIQHLFAFFIQIYIYNFVYMAFLILIIFYFSAYVLILILIFKNVFLNDLKLTFLYLLIFWVWALC